MYVAAVKSSACHAYKLCFVELGQTLPSLCIWRFFCILDADLCHGVPIPQDIEQRVRQHPALRNLPADHITAIIDGLERRVCSKVYRYGVGSLLFRFCACGGRLMAWNEQVLCPQVRGLNLSSPSFLFFFWQGGVLPQRRG